GPDSFTFKANDGTADGNVATVSITVTPVNDPPVADAQSVTTAEDTAVSIILTGSDVDGDALAYSVVAGPAHGDLTGSGQNWVYTPHSNFNGADSFAFAVADNATNSSTATVAVTVTAVNDAPVADAKSLATAEDSALNITLTGSDVDGDALTFTVVTGPAHGTLTGTDANRVYTPAANFNGTDSFTFTVNDGTLDGNVATVSINVTAVNDPPVANAQSITTAEDTAVNITLTGSDVDGDALTYIVVADPTHGTLTGSGVSRTYTPAANYNGPD